MEGDSGSGEGLVPGPSSSNSSLDLDSSRFVTKQREIVERIVRLTNEAEEMWNLLARDQQVCSTLIIKQIFVADRYKDFHQIWSHIDFHEDVDNYLKFVQINDHMNQIHGFLEAFENKTHKTNTILQELRDAFLLRNSELNSILSECMSSTEIEQLENLRIPDFSGIRTNAYGDLNELSQEWDEFDFHSKLDACFEALESIQF